MIVVVIFCNCVIFFQLCFLNLFFFIYKFRDLNDFGPQISELEKLVDEKNLKIKECEFKLQEKDMKIGSQRKKIKKMKEEILTTKKNMKLVTFGGFVLLSLIVILVAMIWSIIAP
jgi:hypothetical protein